MHFRVKNNTKPQDRPYRVCSLEKCAQCPIIETRIKRHKVKALYDTGACISVINKSPFERIYNNKSRENLYLKNQKLPEVIAANGEPFKLLGVIQIPIRLNKHSIKIKLCKY